MIPRSKSRRKLDQWLPRACGRRSRDESGATLVETAVTMVLLLGLIFGVIEVSLAMYSYHFVSDAAREGTRYAMVRGSTWGASCASYASSGCTATPANIESYVASLNFPGINVTTSDVCVEYLSTLPSSVPTSCTANSSPNAEGDVVEVQVTYPFTFAIPGFPGYTYSLKSISQMVIAQ